MYLSQLITPVVGMDQASRQGLAGAFSVRQRDPPTGAGQPSVAMYGEEHVPSSCDTNNTCSYVVSMGIDYVYSAHWLGGIF